MTSILSPYGEGYCRVCRFIVGLDENSLLDHHVRGTVTDYGHKGVAEMCKGSFKRPAKVTPYYAAKNRFLTRLSKVTCHLCGNRVNRRLDDRYASHSQTSIGNHPCPGGYRLIRDHTGERG